MTTVCPHCGAEIQAGDYMCGACRTVIWKPQKKRRPLSPFGRLPDRVERSFIPLGGCRDVVLLCVAAVVLLFLMASCAAPKDQPEPTATSTATPVPTPDGGTVEVAFGDAVVTAEVADEHEERLIGLMHRRSLAEDAGMLFRFPGKTSGGFWMKNTLIPLSIAYMEETDEGYEILVILDMEPCTDDPCPNYPPGQPYDATLEVNLGWFDRHGIKPGDTGVIAE